MVSQVCWLVYSLVVSFIIGARCDFWKSTKMCHFHEIWHRCSVFVPAVTITEVNIGNIGLPEVIFTD